MFEHDYGCVFCRYEYDDSGKYDYVVKKGRLLVKLKPIAETLFVCPKCGKQHVGPGFKDEKAIRKIRARKRRMNVQRLKETYH